MNYAIIDIGSNTIRFNIYTVEGGHIKLLFGKKHMAGLVSYIEDNKLNDKGILKLCRILKSQKEIIHHIKTDATFAFATASLRNIDNSRYVLEYIRDITGIDIELISQKEEAQLGFNGIMKDFSYRQGITLDIGGGSTEITKFRDKTIESMITLRKGSLSLFNNYVKGILPEKKELKKIKKSILKDLEGKNEEHIQSDIIIGIGGTIRATGNMTQELFNLPQNTHFTNKELNDFYSLLEEKDSKTIKTLLKVSPDRIHTLAPGLVILKTLCRTFNAKDILVSRWGLREGFLLEKLKG